MYRTCAFSFRALSSSSTSALTVRLSSRSLVSCAASSRRASHLPLECSERFIHYVDIVSVSILF